MWLDMPAHRPRLARPLHGASTRCTGEQYHWGQANYVRLEPWRSVAHIVALPRSSVSGAERTRLPRAAPHDRSDMPRRRPSKTPSHHRASHDLELLAAVDTITIRTRSSAPIPPPTAPIRALRPDAESVTRRHRRDDHPLDARRERVFAPPWSDTRTSIDYRYPRHLSRVDTTVLVADGYRFLPSLGELDLHLFAEGRHERLWEILGAHPRSYSTPDGDVDGTSFAVWAPNAHGVTVIGDFDGWGGQTAPMRALGSTGVWEVFVPDIGAGQLYKFRFTATTASARDKADPMASAPRSRRPPRR